MYATNYLEAKILNMLRGTSITALSTVYLALYLNSPTESGVGGTEVSYAGYTRMPIELSEPSAMNGGIGFKNVSDITYPLSRTAAGTATYVGILDSLVGGNMLIYAELTEPLVILADEAPVIVAEEARFWLTGNMSLAYKAKVLNTMRNINLSGFEPYLSLYSGNPESGGSELNGGAYGRVALVFSAPSAQETGASVIANSERATTARATTPWGTWTHTAVFDDVSNGTPVFFDERTPKEMRRGLLAVVDVGGLSLVVN